MAIEEETMVVVCGLFLTNKLIMFGIRPENRSEFYCMNKTLTVKEIPK